MRPDEASHLAPWEPSPSGATSATTMTRLSRTDSARESALAPTGKKTTVTNKAQQRPLTHPAYGSPRFASSEWRGRTDAEREAQDAEKPRNVAVWGGAMTPFKQEIRFTRSADGTRLAYAVHGDGRYPARPGRPLADQHRRGLEDAGLAALVRRARRALPALSLRLPGLRPLRSRIDRRLARRARRRSRGRRRRRQAGSVRAARDSQGGALSIAYAARHPERVSHIVLLGAFARGPLRRDPTETQLASLEAELKMIEVGWGQDNPAYRQLFTNLMFPGRDARADPLVQRSAAHVVLAAAGRAHRLAASATSTRPRICRG